MKTELFIILILTITWFIITIKTSSAVSVHKKEANELKEKYKLNMKYRKASKTNVNVSVYSHFYSVKFLEYGKKY